MSFRPPTSISSMKITRRPLLRPTLSDEQETCKTNGVYLIIIYGEKRLKLIDNKILIRSCPALMILGWIKFLFQFIPIIPWPLALIAWSFQMNNKPFKHFSTKYPRKWKKCWTIEFKTHAFLRAYTNKIPNNHFGLFVLLCSL